jgi:hypothetical protein
MEVTLKEIEEREREEESESPPRMKHVLQVQFNYFILKLGDTIINPLGHFGVLQTSFHVTSNHNLCRTQWHQFVLVIYCSEIRGKNAK